jgi:pyruvate formate lyase activating enzyme
MDEITPEQLRKTRGTVFAVDQTATHDGPGLRMMIYLKGCPLRCVWCHSPESQSPTMEVVWYQARCVQCGKCVEVCPKNARSFEPILPDDVDRNACYLCGQCIEACEHGGLEMKGYRTSAGKLVDEAVRLKPFFRRSGGGVTLSGGEPMLQPDFAYAILALCRMEGIHTAIETTGVTTWERLERVATVTDLALYDLKHADPAAHEEFTGAPLDRVTGNLRLLLSYGTPVVVRVPVIPGFNGSAETIRDIGALAAELGAKRIELLPFNPSASGKYSWLQRPYPLAGVKRQSDEEMRALEAVVAEAGLEVVRA